MTARGRAEFLEESRAQGRLEMEDQTCRQISRARAQSEQVVAGCRQVLDSGRKLALQRADYPVELAIHPPSIDHLNDCGKSSWRSSLEPGKVAHRGGVRRRGPGPSRSRRRSSCPCTGHRSRRT
jgi:hypothetical protein